jgi:hypothetical protein
MRATRWTGMVLVLALAGLLVACSSAAGPSVTPAAEITPTVVPTTTPNATPTPSPVLTPPTAERTPSATPTEAAPEPTPAVEITQSPTGLHAGDRASVTARTPSGVPCTLSYGHGYSGGSVTGGPTATKLATKTASAEGTVRWRWTVEPTGDLDTVDVSVECGDGEQEGVDRVTIWIWPSDLSASATLPPELLGTWTMPPEDCSDCGDETFAIGPCSLGERCGSLIEADKPACRFPLVFATIAPPGVFILDAGEDDSAGCPEGWGQGLHFKPNADGTAQLYTVDGTNSILHRVVASPAPSAAP